MRHQHQLGLAREALAKFRQPQRHQLRIHLLKALAQLERKALNYRSVANVQHVDVAVFRIAQQRKDVDRTECRIQHRRLGLVGVETLEALLDKLGGLKLLGGGVGHHLAKQSLTRRLQITPKQLAGSLHVSQVAALILAALARSQTALNVKLQTGSVLAGLNGRLVHRQLAGTQREHFFDDVEHRVHHLHRSIGAEVFRAVLDAAARGKNPRKALLFDAHPGVGLAVLEVDVVARLVLLDQRVLEQQRIKLGLGDNRLNVGDLAHQHAESGGIVALMEVRTYPLLQIFGLADVQDHPILINVVVHPRTLR